ncbi:hypothetical protein [Pelagicoccus sp. SDUM812002]|uniref:hypothetical protein n=1 Tax=Pelagicoccus sp. SDUM812002 TaxID=3041266 RepID=UPI00280F9C76|nr:hypothetical protein [Pelagicoccus sp. SDUM812002]MDQ8185521.1 hypothetical protein [Pelagicoccus sp. SDUM812002]
MFGIPRSLLVALVLALGSPGFASEIGVVRVDFELVNQEGGREPWYEIAVVVSVEEGESDPDANPRFADDVTVSVALAAEVNRGRGRGYEFYANRMEYPALEVGQHAVRFFLPPEIVKRDRVRGEPFAYEIEVFSAEGLEFSLVSNNLDNPAALQSFHSQLAASKSDSSVLLPQYQTPFAWAYPRDTPTARQPSR